MRLILPYRMVLLVAPLLAAGGLMAAESPPAQQSLPPAQLTEFNFDDWESHLLSPTGPARGQSTANQAPAPKETHPRVSIAAGFSPDKWAEGNASTQADRLAALAQQDRDFFRTLNQNPDTWIEAERDRRAQEVNDNYIHYLADHPNDLSALVLYGKFLRKVGKPELAYQIMQRAHRLDPKIAVVYQQLANYLAESGRYAQALENLRQATVLAPEEPLYHYQLGELLNIYYDRYLGDKTFDLPTLNKTIAGEFSRAAALAPQEPGFAWRYAECFYDLREPDWNAALAAWDDVARRTTAPVELEVIRLHRARVLLELGRRDEARPLIEQPVRAALESSRAQLAQRLQKASPAPGS